MGDPNVDLIMVATGTGIAPYRSFIRRLFVEKTPYGEVYSGLAWLFLGVANTDALLYDDEWQEVLKSHPDNFKLDYALSREQTNKEEARCTSRTRWLSTPTRSSRAWTMARTCISAA